MNPKIASIVVGATLVLSAPLAMRAEAAVPDREGAVGDTIVVQITDEGFRPASVTVHRGDFVRFLQHSGTPHNVEFLRTPEGARIGAERSPITIADAEPAALPPLRFGPYLLGIGEAYDVRVDEFLAAGVYEYRCASHDYRGLLVVMDEIGL